MVGARHDATAVAAPVPDGPSLVAPSHTHGRGPRAGASRVAASGSLRRRLATPRGVLGPALEASRSTHRWRRYPWPSLAQVAAASASWRWRPDPRWRRGLRSEQSRSCRFDSKHRRSRLFGSKQRRLRPFGPEQRRLRPFDSEQAATLARLGPGSRAPPTGNSGGVGVTP
ncbi:unnamed protein product [Miscanthus lutarioriparius]|uniref:Uncharacterized protein n=1 Tax=Miscanthus lutarioriparius TaxID=422564 RepID=A0A811S1H6_9POAL|nr:unnamed protein product [Miscanthus lutarioriparius]